VDRAQRKVAEYQQQQTLLLPDVGKKKKNRIYCHYVQALNLPWPGRKHHFTCT
jgi:hypothetical protein